MTIVPAAFVLSLKERSAMTGDAPRCASIGAATMEVLGEEGAAGDAEGRIVLAIGGVGCGSVKGGNEESSLFHHYTII
jgi:hypothetical protein